MNKDTEIAEREAHSSAFQTVHLRDKKRREKGKHVLVDGEVHKNRPNYRNAIQLRKRKGATIHTIGIGDVSIFQFHEICGHVEKGHTLTSAMAN